AASRAGITMMGFSGAAAVTVTFPRTGSDNMPGSSGHRKRDIATAPCGSRVNGGFYGRPG
ncbi:MAG TPA: hypothetical protein VE687_12085, partial [Stellaceae bacterium]|nr:hypothetical protein [Stellaceae bacterium]